MPRKFNDTGFCALNRHDMVDASHKLARSMQLIEEEGYFTMNRPRQFGKPPSMCRLTDYKQEHAIFKNKQIFAVER